MYGFYRVSPRDFSRNRNPSITISPVHQSGSILKITATIDLDSRLVGLADHRSTLYSVHTPSSLLSTQSIPNADGHSRASEQTSRTSPLTFWGIPCSVCSFRNPCPLPCAYRYYPHGDCLEIPCPIGERITCCSATARAAQNGNP